MAQEGENTLSDIFSNLQLLWGKRASFSEKLEPWYPIYRQLSIVVIMGIILFSMPGFLLTILFFAIYKLVVICCAKIYQPDLDQPVPSPSAFLAQENSMVTASKFNVLTMLVLDGNLTLNEIRTAFQNRVLNKRNEEGQLVYPELKQYWTTYLGYYFWKSEECFNLMDHIRMYDYCPQEDLERVDVDGFKRIISEVLPQPWKEGYSPWELLMVPNYYDSVIDRPQILLMFRIHHGMGDGHSIMNITFTDLAQVKPVIPRPSRPRVTLQEKIVAILTLPIRLLYDLAEIACDSFEELGTPTFDDNRPKRDYHVCFTSERFETQKIKEVKTKFGVSFNSVVCTAMSGGIRQIMMDAGMDVPTRFSCGLAYPLPDRPKKGLVNHAILFFHKWPLGFVSREERLQNIFNSMNKSKFYTAPIFSWILVSLLTVFPNGIQRLISYNSRATIAASFFPGPENRFKYLGCTPTDIMFTVGLPVGKWEIFCTTLSLFGKQRFVIVMDKKFFPSAEVFKRLDGYISREFHAMLNSNNNHVETIMSDKKTD